VLGHLTIALSGLDACDVASGADHRVPRIPKPQGIRGCDADACAQPTLQPTSLPGFILVETLA
jgi:hypothetical protein